MDVAAGWPACVTLHAWMSPREHFRSTARHAIDLPVTIRDAADTLAREARLLDLSIAGARVAVAGRIQQGGQVVLEIKTPTLWDPLVLDAVVAWSRTLEPPAWEAGLKFVHRSPSSASALFELLGTQGFEAP